MGAQFDFSHINLIAYLTDETDRAAPRSDKDTVGKFLLSLAYSNVLISPTQGRARDWTKLVSNTAAAQLERLNFQFGESSNADPMTPEIYLNPLREYFRGYEYYALIISGSKNHSQNSAMKFYREAALSSNGLILFPSKIPDRSIAQFVDPFPALQVFADQPLEPPCVVFWTRAGSACVLSLDTALNFLRDELSVSSADSINHAIANKASLLRPKRILHLSDLHLGSDGSSIKKTYLQSKIKSLLPNIDRVAVTGDLFNNPSRNDKNEFFQFRSDIEAYKSKKLLVVPGNHDLRKYGNAFGPFGRKADYFTDVPWSPIDVDHDAETVFISFNSCEFGDFARGRVSNDQRLSRATEYDLAIEKDAKVKNYFKVALVHHHPVNYGAEPTSLYERILSRFPGGGEKFLAFEKSDEFLKWCANRGIKLVLHGHKHVPHLATVRPVETRTHEVTTVGCGSSTGAEGKPMCFDIITLDPITERWSVKFFQDGGDGSGFVCQNVAIDFREDR